MAVHRDSDPRKNMSHAQIAVAIRRLDSSGVAWPAIFTCSIIGAEGGSKEPRQRGSLHNGDAPFGTPPAAAFLNEF
jgi:hypothetical protein